MKKIIYIAVFVVFGLNISFAQAPTAAIVETEKVEAAVRIQWFPNPTKDKLEITSTTDLKKIEVRTLEGKELKVVYSP